MKIFLDTSSLFKLYHREAGTAELELLFSTVKITHTFLSEITKIEFTSTIWKKVRTKEITESEAQITIDLFESDFEKYTFIPTDTIIIEQARILVSKYGMQGLRTLDSIQLSTSVLLLQSVDLFLTADNLLKSFFKAEGLQTEMTHRFH
ncbi:MAG TPA: type II toxin-antitoxin system VapC family toxin [Hanamia sp.]|nr:type II toxin-antitoxin system VapC family toxin [Hanamia sp.]